jgi:AcrR family transcriptional regulator
MTPRPDVSEERKNQILEAATVVFARRGYQNARMDDIVAESGLSKGALYWYFKSKDDLILGIVENMLIREFDKLQSVPSWEGTVKDRLLAFVDLTIADLEEMLQYMPIFYEFFAMAMRRDEIRKIFTDYFRSYMEIFTPVIQEGIDHKEFWDIPAEDVAIALIAVLEGTILLMVYDPEMVDVTKHMRVGTRLVLDGLTRPGVSSSA